MTKAQELINLIGEDSSDGQIHSVTVNTGDYEVQILDGTHLQYRLMGTEKWAIPLHIAQLSPEWIKQLKAKGLTTDDGRHFVMEARSVTLVVKSANSKALSEIMDFIKKYDDVEWEMK